MTAIVVPNYPLDLTSTDPRNRITNEKHTFVKDTDRIFVPSAGPFYVSSFVIRDATTGAFLKPTIDYKLLHPDIDAIHESGLHVCCVVFVLNTAISSVSIDYQVIGGQYSDLIPVVRELLANTDTIQPTINWYTQVYAKPDSYPPAPHWHTGNEFTEWDRIALRLDEIMSALVYKDRYTWQSAYEYVDRIVKLASDSLRVDLDMTQQFNNVYSKTQATELFLSKVDAATIYLSKSDAGATYLSKTDASTTYLTKNNAVSTYATRDDLASANDSLTTLINNVATNLNQNYIKKTDADIVNSLISSTNSTILSMINERTKVSPDSGNVLVKRANGFYVPVPVQPDLTPYAKTVDVSATVSGYTYDKKTIDNKISNVTIDIAALLKDPRFQQYKVGDVFYTTNNYLNADEVAAAVGYGTWVRYARGRVLIGSTQIDSPSGGSARYVDFKDDANNNLFFVEGATGGEASHVLSVQEMAAHGHSPNLVFNKFAARASGFTQTKYYKNMGDDTGVTIDGADNINSDDEIVVNNINPIYWDSDVAERVVGDNQSHNNLQPYVVGQYWLRVPDPVTYVLYYTTDAAGNNRVTWIYEGMTAYIWIAVANSKQGVMVKGVQYLDTGNNNISGVINTATTLSNGKNLLSVMSPGENYILASTVTIGTIIDAKISVTLLDIATAGSSLVYNEIGIWKSDPNIPIHNNI